VNCDRIRELASEALDGTLSGSGASRFSEHVDACPPCRSFLGQLRESLLLLQELPSVEVGEDFERRVWSRIRAEEVGVGRWESLVRRVRSEWESTAPAFARWSPVAVAAGVLAMFAVTSSPDGSQWAASADGERSETVEASAPRGVAAPIESADRVTHVAQIAEPEAESVPDSAEELDYGIPRAVEAYLNSGRELRARSEQQYLRSNYSYPLTRVRVGGGMSGVGEGRPVSENWSPAAGGGATVISF